jgi:hypothetical protein
MSAEGIIWAQKLLPLLANDSQRVVLLHFGLRANMDGLLWPSVADIATELGKSERAIRRTLKELDGEELINVDSDYRTDGSQKSNYYQLLLSVTPQELLKRRRTRARVIMSTSRKRFTNRMSRHYELIDHWGQTLTSIRAEINPRTFDTWYAPLKFRGINKRSLVLGMPAEEFENYFKDKRARKVILDAAKRYFDTEITVVYFRVQS